MLSKRKRSKKKKSTAILRFLRRYMAYILLILVVLAFVTPKKQIVKFIGKQFDSENQKNCPSKILGNKSSNIRIKYFETPYCPACWEEEIMAFPKLLKRMSDSFYMEKYDTRYCKAEKKRYKVKGTPTFVFQDTNTTKEFVHFGYLSYKKLRKGIISLKGEK